MPPPTETVTVLSSVNVLPVENAAVTVTVVPEAPSLRLDGFADRFTSGAPSSLRIVPVAVSVAVIDCEVSETVRLTVNVSSASTTASSVVATVKVCVSFAVPAKVSGVVFAV